MFSERTKLHKDPYYGDYDLHEYNYDDNYDDNNLHDYHEDNNLINPLASASVNPFQKTDDTEEITAIIEKINMKPQKVKNISTSFKTNPKRKDEEITILMERVDIKPKGKYERTTTPMTTYYTPKQIGYKKFKKRHQTRKKKVKLK